MAKSVDSLLMQMSHDLAVATAAWGRVGTVWQRPLLLLCQASHPCLDLCVCAVVSSVSPLLQLSFPATVLPWIPFRGCRMFHCTSQVRLLLQGLPRAFIRLLEHCKPVGWQ